MADVFNRATEFGAAISADGARVSFDGFQVGMLAQNANLVYAQQVTRIFELSSNRQYYVAGRPSGNISMTRIVGPIQVTNRFTTKFGDVCNAAKNTLNLSAAAGCAPIGSGAFNSGTGGVSYTATNVVITQLGIQVGAQDMLISESFQMMFVGLHNQ